MKPPVPEWVDHAVFYQIYPQTFCDSNGDGIGDLPGIISKLDYVKSLGVDAIWLSPFYASPMRDAGYDVADFYSVHPRYGTNEDARRLFDEAHRRGLRVLLDFVVGHTSIDHPWFRASCQETPNRYRNWYVWTQSSWDNGGEDYRSSLVRGYSDRDGNYLFNFFWHQPALNFGFTECNQPWQLPTTHPDVRALWDEMHNVLCYWLRMGADGFRVDMAGSITRNDPGRSEARRFWQEAQEKMAAIRPDVFTVAEWSSPKDALDGKGLHADFLHWDPSYEDLFRLEVSRNPAGSRGGHSFFDREGKGDIAEFLRVYLAHYVPTSDKGYISIPVANHDLPRISMERTDRELEIVYAFLFTMPGVPFFYYGDEIGMRQLLGLPAKEGCYTPRAGARTPMQWSDDVNAGFSAAAPDKLWYPVDSAPGAPSVQEQETCADSLLHRVRALIGLRHGEPALAAHAKFEVLYAQPFTYPFIFTRENAGRRIAVVLNPADRGFEVELLVPRFEGKAKLLAGFGTQYRSIGEGTIFFAGEGCSYGVYLL